MSVNLDRVVTHAVAVTGTVTLTLDSVDGLIIGSRVDVSGIPGSGGSDINGTNFTLTAVDTTNKKVTYSHDNKTLASTDTDGTLHIHVTWIADTDVELFLGFDALGTDQTYLTACVDAANDWCYRKRNEAGYDDHPAYQLNAAPKQGTVLYAATLYRERGTTGDAMPGFEPFGQFDRPVSLGRVMQLLGCGKPQVG